jgi:hypothetical protein
LWSATRCGWVVIAFMGMSGFSLQTLCPKKKRHPKVPS